MSRVLKEEGTRRNTKGAGRAGGRKGLHEDLAEPLCEAAEHHALLVDPARRIPASAPQERSWPLYRDGVRYVASRVACLTTQHVLCCIPGAAAGPGVRLCHQLVLNNAPSLPLVEKLRRCTVVRRHAGPNQARLPHPSTGYTRAGTSWPGGGPIGRSWVFKAAQLGNSRASLGTKDCVRAVVRLGFIACEQLRPQLLPIGSRLHPHKRLHNTVRIPSS